MKIEDSNKHIFDMGLAKCIGYYEMLDIETETFIWAVITSTTECLCFSLLAHVFLMCLNGLHYSINMTESVIYFGLLMLY